MSDIKYSNRWSIQVDGGKEEEDRLAKKDGFLNEGKARIVVILIALHLIVFFGQQLSGQFKTQTTANPAGVNADECKILTAD